MNYLDWFALSTWCLCIGVLLFAWGLDEIKYSHNPSKYADLALVIAMKMILAAMLFGWISTDLLLESCDALPSTATECLAAPVEYKHKEPK